MCLVLIYFERELLTNEQNQHDIGFWKTGTHPHSHLVILKVSQIWADGAYTLVLRGPPKV